MNKALAKNNPIFFSLFLFLLFLSVGCTPDSKQKKPQPEPDNTSSTSDPKGPPILLIVGEDLSGSYEGFVKLEMEDMKTLSDKIIKSGRGGAIALFGIGNPTPKGYEYFEIPVEPSLEGLNMIDKKLALEKIARTRKLTLKKQEQFLEKAEEILSTRGQKQTDINGFFQKANTFSQQEQFDGFQKWLYVNSDGNQDVTSGNKKSKMVNCSLLPSVDKFYLSGWKHKIDCSSTNKFLDPRGFVSNFPGR